MQSNLKSRERVLVVGLCLKDKDVEDAKESLCELEDLVFAAGGEVCSNQFQKLDKYNSATLIGKGKVEEIKQIIEELKIDLVVVDHRLSGIQNRNLYENWKVNILDRSQLILDIFAQRAQTYEGKLQVELAQMLDQLPRMVGAWQGSLSRQGGGIGTKGPGETALEMDRRRIHNKVKQIKGKLESVRKTREQQRNRRQKNDLPTFSLIGYTNSGKSTLLNKLSKSDIYAKDQLFATLDAQTKKVFLTPTEKILVTDTVGFIRNLPTQLIEAFKSTLEESAHADVLLYVVDISHPQMLKQMEVIDNIITDLEWSDKPVLYVFNKMDKVDMANHLKVDRLPRVFVSAHTEEGLDEFKVQVQSMLEKLTVKTALFFPRGTEQKVYDLGKRAHIESHTKTDNGSFCTAHIKKDDLENWSEFIIEH